MSNFSSERFYNSVNWQAFENTDLFRQCDKKLNEKRWYKPAFDYAERTTKVNRVYLVSGLSCMIILSLLLEFGTSLICQCVGVLYPGYKTLQLLENPNIYLCQKWLLYWFIHAGLNLVEFFLFFLPWVPCYWIFKCVFLLSCYMPLESNGSDLLYERCIRPMFLENQQVIQNTVNQAVRTARTISSSSEMLFSEHFQIPSIDSILAEKDLDHPHIL